MKTQKIALSSVAKIIMGTSPKDTIFSFKIPYPNHRERIVDIVQKYDTLANINRRRIQLLEKSARLLFREWFVYFRFLGHEKVKIVDGVPEGWGKKLLGEISPLKYGKALREDDRVPGSVPVFGSSG